jgi:hypothetical protein
VARQVSNEIRRTGLATWLDDMDLHGGDDIKSAIRSGIEGSQELLVIISPNSQMSQWVIYEAAIAEVLGRRITPIFNNVSPDVIAPLKGIKGYDLNEFDKYLLELGRRAGHTEQDRK